MIIHNYTTDVCLAEIHGKILQYDGANPARWSKIYTAKDGWEYLGEGVIWSVNGVKQAGIKQQLHFWKSKFTQENK